MRGGTSPEEARREVERLEGERLRLAPEVTGGDPAAVEEDRRLERRLRELANAEREARSMELMEGWRRRRADEGGSGRSGGKGPE